MNCPNCGAPMKSGRIETNALLHVIMRHPANIVFVPDNPFDRKKTSSPFARQEGWYCEDCDKIVGVFDVSR